MEEAKINLSNRSVPSGIREYDNEKTLESLPKSSANDTQDIQNGGFTAWLQVLVTFFIFFNTW